MEPILTAHSMKEADRLTIEQIGISSLVLMESAGRSISNIIESNHEHILNPSATIFCGKGNNGGDGMVVGRSLASKGWRVNIILLFNPDRLSVEAKHQLGIISKMTELDEDLTVSVRYHEDSPKIWDLAPSDIVIDAIFGTGSNSDELPATVSSAIEWMNSSNAVVYSIDIPSGLHADKGSISNSCVNADYTFTLGALKQGLFINDGPIFSGEIQNIDIGIPQKLLFQSNTFLNSITDVQENFPVRFENMHKYEAGHVVIFAGSVGMHGAAILCANAALSTGAGIVTLFTDQEVYLVVASQLQEILVIPVDYNSDLLGSETVTSKLEKADCVIIGPGLGRKPQTLNFVRSLINEIEIPVVLDADGLYAFNGMATLLQNSKAPLILTPHLGEFSRLIEKTSEVISENPIEIVREFSAKIGHTVILKGRHTLVVSSNGVVIVNPTGNSGMATAGSGDVLTGMIGSVIAQGVYLDIAASDAVFLHGYAGDIAADFYSEYSVTASKIIECIPDAIQELFDGETE